MSSQRVLQRSSQRFACLVVLVTLCAGNASSMASSSTASTENTQVHVALCSGAELTAAVSKQALTYSITRPGQAKTERKVQLDIERQPHLVVEDYNFDGRPDLSVWYVDEGMGTSTIHRVFVFDPDSQDLKEVAPDCGEEFLNLKVDKSRHQLISTVFKQGKPSVCKTSLAGKRSPAVQGSPVVCK